MSKSTPTIDDVRAYWNSKPLFSHEVAEVGSPAYFDRIDTIKRTDVERFGMEYWEFDRFKGKNVLDIGCGPGWLTTQYARGGANVTAIDLTDAAVELTRKHLAYRGLHGTVSTANAEALPFDDGTFDLVASSGVLHHTPDTQATFRESLRVLRPGGTAKITLYRLGVLHQPTVFRLTKATMRLLGVRHPGADMAGTASGVEDFVRQYDGAGNPIGIAKTNEEWAEDLRRAGFVVVRTENHFFPARFLPMRVPRSAHLFLDRTLGTMVYFTLRKQG